MKPVRPESIDKVWRVVTSMNRKESQSMMGEMNESQPHLLEYLMKTDDGVLNDSERGMLLYLGVVLWKIMKEEGAHLRVVQDTEIAAAANRNLKMVEYLEGEPESDYMKTIQFVLQNYNQVQVLRSITESIVNDPEEGGRFRDENKGLAMLHLKTVLDCLDQ
jgi:hypothetical protein